MDFKDIENCLKPLINLDTSTAYTLANVNNPIRKTLNLRMYVNTTELDDIVVACKESGTKVYSEGTYLANVIPMSFLMDNVAYAHYNGNFLKIEYVGKTVKFSLVDFNETRGRRVFDYSNFRPNNLERDVFRLKDLAIQALANYEDDHTYNKNRYVEYEKEYITEDKVYSHLYSMKKDDAKKLEEWQEKHAKKYHKGKAYGGGASPVSYFEIRQGFTSIGSFKDCVCTVCLEKYEQEKDAKKKEKLYKQAVFEVDSLG